MDVSRDLFSRPWSRPHRPTRLFCSYNIFLSFLCGPCSLISYFTSPPQPYLYAGISPSASSCCFVRAAVIIIWHVLYKYYVVFFFLQGLPSDWWSSCTTTFFKKNCCAAYFFSVVLVLVFLIYLVWLVFCCVPSYPVLLARWKRFTCFTLINCGCCFRFSPSHSSVLTT